MLARVVAASSTLMGEGASRVLSSGMSQTGPSGRAPKSRRPTRRATRRGRALRRPLVGAAGSEMMGSEAGVAAWRRSEGARRATAGADDVFLAALAGAFFVAWVAGAVVSKACQVGTDSSQPETSKPERRGVSREHAARPMPMRSAGSRGRSARGSRGPGAAPGSARAFWHRKPDAPRRAAAWIRAVDRAVRASVGRRAAPSSSRRRTSPRGASPEQRPVPTC